LIYNIDLLTSNKISGWIENSENQKIIFKVNNKIIGKVSANQFRKDLKDLKISDGYSGFTYYPSLKYRYDEIKIFLESNLKELKQDKSIRLKYLLKNKNLESLSLEIGPLDRPILDSKKKINMFCDHLMKKDLIKKYKKKNFSHIDYKAIIPTDYLLDEILIQRRKKFKFVVASHMLEHHPNPLDLLQKLSKIMEKNSILSLALPSKNYTFDKSRASTSIGNWIEWFHKKQDKPPYSCIFDSKLINYKTKLEKNYLEKAYLETNKIIKKNQYFDCHVSVFTPDEFVKVISGLNNMKLIDFKISNIDNKKYIELDNEFIIQLNK
jgi:hypothetical protein